MATSSYFRNCPMCDGKECLDYCHDTKIGVDGGDVATCLECGWATWVEERFADLVEINEMRLNEELEPLDQLRPHKH